jgi:hypothetical protein
LEIFDGYRWFLFLVVHEGGSEAQFSIDAWFSPIKGGIDRVIGARRSELESYF